MKAEETWAEQATYMYDFHIQELQETGSMWEKLLKKYLGQRRIIRQKEPSCQHIAFGRTVCA